MSSVPTLRDRLEVALMDERLQLEAALAANSAAMELVQGLTVTMKEVSDRLTYGEVTRDTGREVRALSLK